MEVKSGQFLKSNNAIKVNCGNLSVRCDVRIWE